MEITTSVDSNSDDDTSSVVKGLRHQSKVRCVFEKKIGLDRARNRGIKGSQGGIVAFTDDDVIVDVHWLHNLQTCFEETNADVVRGWSLFAARETRTDLVWSEV